MTGGHEPVATLATGRVNKGRLVAVVGISDALHTVVARATGHEDATPLAERLKAVDWRTGWSAFFQGHQDPLAASLANSGREVKGWMVEADQPGRQKDRPVPSADRPKRHRCS